MIIDSHCHAGHGDILTAPWDTDAPLADHLQRAREAGIARTIVFPISNVDMEKANEEVAELVAANPKELIGYYRIHPVRMAGRVRPLLEKAAEKWGFRGIKLHNADGPATREVMEAAADLELPILLDIKDAVGPVEMLAWQYPRVNLILAHLGSFPGDWRVHEATISLMRRYPNVYADTSSVRFFDWLVLAVKEAGAEKLIFGSDGPLLHPGLELMRVKLLKLPPADEALVTGGNIERLMRSVPC
jgi:predicted TIM-barrel fold metal-dependent hydrolase